MMNSKQQREQDAYLKSLLGDECQLGYHSRGARFQEGNSTLGPKVRTIVVPESSRKGALEAN